MKRETIKFGEHKMNVVVTDALPDGVSMMLVGQPDPDAEDQFASMAERSVVVRDVPRDGFRAEWSG